MRISVFLLFFVFLLSCSSEDNNQNSNAYLKLLDSDKTKISFNNLLNETETQNRFTYEYFYNGSGVAVGDIDNDGLPDIYFGGNLVADRLYLNKGKMKFEDISNIGGITEREGWSSGINMADVNADGYLDIYVCRSGPSNNPNARRNLLFINNKNSTFTESGKQYGLDNRGSSVQSAFFDYDLDGDLDMYLLNHPPPSFKAKNLLLDHIEDIKSGRLQTDVFYENVNGRFVDKTKEAGLVNFGFRHGIAVGDLNDDGYPDLYISSDFDEPDQLYYNNGNKTFTNKIDEQIRHISNFSMGNEICDINNDGMNDIYVVDMTPDDHVRSKLNMASMNPRKFFTMAENGFHNQYMVNTLQLNIGNGRFSEVGQLAGISKTDWSWAPLFFDINLDGYKDLFVTNGIKRDILNNDVRINAQQKMEELNRRLSINELLDMVPSTTVTNYVYKNSGKLKFENTTSSWMDNSSFNSNGTAYGDLDGDGDLDLVVNNVDKNASVYQNNSGKTSGNNYIKISLTGPALNPFAIGTKIRIKNGDNIMYYEQHNARGYLSSMDYVMCIGVGKLEEIPSLEINWPDGSVSSYSSLKTNESYSFDYKKENRRPASQIEKINTPLSYTSSQSLGISYKHEENDYDDFATEILLPHRQSKNGPFIASGDINGDGLDDFYVGGAMGQAGTLFVQGSDGRFSNSTPADFEKDHEYEDMNAVFFDIDNDDDLDLYVVSGGNELPGSKQHFIDRLYLNNGSGDFKRDRNALPKLNISGQMVLAQDVDADGDQDLFVSGRMIPGKYPYPADSKILINNNGTMVDGTQDIAPALEGLGMVSSAVFSDCDNDGDKDLIVVGEWMMVTLFENDNGIFTPSNNATLSKTRGIWFTINEHDYDDDGDSDYFIGNLGNNAKFKAGGGKTFHIFSKDFDGTGTNDIVLSSTYNNKLVPVRGRECSSEQMPFIKEKFNNYQKFAEASIDDIFGQELDDALHYEADLLSSILLKNNGAGNFEVIELPMEAQVSAVMDFAFSNIDDDSGKEIILVGNHFGAEVETVRYDACYGQIFKVENGEFIALTPRETGLYTSGDSKDIEIITVGGKEYILVTNNDGALDIFDIKSSLPEG